MAPYRARVRHTFPARGSQAGQSNVYEGENNQLKPRNGKRPTSPTRIEENAHSDDERSGEVISHKKYLKGDSENDSYDDQVQEPNAAQIRPYNRLLQRLTTTAQPQRKKRKSDTTRTVENVVDSGFDNDFVEESEELKALGADELVDPEDEVEIEGDYSPFDLHLAEPDESKVLRKIESLRNSEVLTTKNVLTSPWSFISKNPACSNDALSSRRENVRNVNQISLKQRLRQSAAKLLPSFDILIGSIASSIFTYQDVIFPHRTPGTGEDFRKLNCLHSLNHIFKTRDKVIKNNARIANANGAQDIEVRDQGFTRPKVLIILPTRQSCVKYINTLTALAEPEQQENKKRYQDSYTVTDDPLSEHKPEDFRELFSGNDDDMFRIGLKFTRKTIKYFAQFYNSDIIFASPLGLRMALGAEGSKKKDYDFLSSIEITIVDQADALAMQNWEHIEYIFKHLNLQPKEAHGCDFSRVRNWYLDNNAKFLRQTILISAFNFPSLNSLYSHSLLNIAGKVKYLKQYEGAILNMGIQVKQRFSRYETTSMVADPDDRFNHFVSTIVPYLTKNAQESKNRKNGLLIFLPLYADFVRVRNYLSTSANAQSISFGSISEYTPIRDVARARSHFESGRHSVLLYTERAHHFRRYHITGVKGVIMYGLPENPLFYKEVVGGFLESSMIGVTAESSSAYVRSLFSRLDVLKLERVVGTKRFLPLLKDKGGDTFDFV